MDDSSNDSETPRKNIQFTGGAGTSIEDAVIIQLSSPFMGVLAEYAYIIKVCGRMGEDWEVDMQMVVFNKKTGKKYDLIAVKLKDGTIRDFYFYIDLFFGKTPEKEGD